MKKNTQKVITIGTFNVAAGLLPDTQAINRLVASYNVDVVGFQEVDYQTLRNPYDMLESLAGEVYPARFYSKTMNWHGGGEYGLGIVSKYPLITNEYGMYKVTGEENRLYQRVVIDVEGQLITLFNTHLSFESKEIRASQAEQLLMAVDSQERTVITGDFNFSDDLREWEPFHEFQLANSQAFGLKDTFLYKDDTMANFAIDNIMASRPLTLETSCVSTTPLSDHALLIATIKL